MADLNVGDDVYFIKAALGIVSPETITIYKDTIKSVVVWTDTHGTIYKKYVVSYEYDIPVSWCYATKQDCIDSIKRKLDEL